MSVEKRTIVEREGGACLLYRGHGVERRGGAYLLNIG